MKNLLRGLLCLSLASGLWACDSSEDEPEGAGGVGEGGVGEGGSGEGGSGEGGSGEGGSGEGGSGEGGSGEGGAGPGGEGGAGAGGMGAGGQGGMGAGGEGGMGGGGAGGMMACVDETYWPDADGDGHGEPGGMAVEADTCNVPDDHAPSMDDCAGDDPWRNPSAAEICDDNLDDDCDGEDEACPETAPLGMNVPDWDCTGEPPQNVYAWARFDDGGGYFQDGGCFVFFEGSPDQFFVQRKNIERVNQDPSCEGRNGCVCPSLGGWPSYDRRLYAFTLAGGVDECEQISIRDHAGEDQTVSNRCRKYLYQMHFYDIPYSFVAEGVDVLERRLSLFPTVEIACAEDAPHRNLPFQSLINAAVQKNPAFAPLRR